MADTKISALTAVVTPAGTDQYATNQGGTSKKTTLAQIMTFVNTAPIWAAGTASAGTWPTFTSGTLLTTAVSGTWEYDGKAVYFTVGSSRGVLPTTSLIRLTTAFTTPGGTTTLQKLFNSPTNGQIVLPASTTYFFECVFDLSGMSASSGDLSFGFVIGAGALANVTYQAVGKKATVGPAAASHAKVTGAASGQILAANTGTAAQIIIKGSFQTGAAGATITPSFATSVAAASVVAVGSYFMCWSAGLDTVQSVGNWS